MLRKPSLPPVFDAAFYRTDNPDLAHLSEHQLEEHYRANGIEEGRAGSMAAWRNVLIDVVHKEQAVLEIGPFANPAISGSHVRYLDAYDTEELIKRCKWHDLDASRVPQIDYVSPRGTFEMIDRKFSAAFGSHSIEHQPDFVRHLQNVSSILEDGGRYYIISPDKRFCFDHFRSETTVADVVAAYLLNVVNHLPRTFATHALLVTHNDPVRHWAGDHGEPSYKTENTLRLEQIVDMIECENYVDSHAWQNTPKSFHEITSTLFKHGLIDLYPERVYHTPRNMFEFMVVLRKGQPSGEPAFIDSGQPKSAAAQSDQVESLKLELANMKSSRSWKLTAPLRWIRSGLRI
jgi:hypothetical protein